MRKPSEGTIELDVPPGSVAYCPDAAEFEPWLTALEVLDVAAGLLGRPRPEPDLRGMLDQVGLSDAAGRRVGGFSRGMRSRLGLAAGLIGKPKLLIADEPAAALDPAGRWEIIDLLAALRGTVTVIVSSHDLADVERICDRIGVLANGRLVYQGPVSELLALAAPALRLVVRPPAERAPRGTRRGPLGSLGQRTRTGRACDRRQRSRGSRAALPRVLANCGARLVEASRAGVSLQDIFFELTATGPAGDDSARQH